MQNKNIQLLDAESSLLFICDVQEIFETKIISFDILVETCKTMIKMAKILNLPIIVSEQNPKAFGPTVNDIRNLLPDNQQIHKKTKFSRLWWGLWAWSGRPTFSGKFCFFCLFCFFHCFFAFLHVSPLFFCFFAFFMFFCFF